MAQTSSCPDTILVWIPWYPDGLSIEERGAVESHAADCADCRAEIAYIAGEEEPEIEVPDPDRVYARVTEHIDSYEKAEGQMAEAALPRRLRQELHLRAAKPLSMAAGLLVALVSGMATIGVIWVAREVPAYQTASATAVTAMAGPELEIVFRPDATAAAIQQTLRSAGASLISGPSERGVYRVRLNPGADVEAALKLLRGDGRGVAGFAEPKSG
ncbi:MAG: zf-HC2 domain-containing protein [Myxococcota bacterium]